MSFRNTRDRLNECINPMKFLSYQISDLFANEGSTLSKIVDKVNAIHHLQSSFEKLLPSEITAHCRLGQYDNGIITLFTDSAATATQLRFQVPQLLSQLRQDKQFAGLRSIQIKIAQYMPTYQKEDVSSALKTTPLQLSPENAEALRQIAEGLEGTDAGTQKLIDSLMHLAEKGKV